MVSDMSSAKSRARRQEEEADAFPPTVATDFEDDERPGRSHKPQAEGSATPWRSALGVALVGLAVYAVVRALRH
jgi:hypothetical protein